MTFLEDTEALVVPATSVETGGFWDGVWKSAGYDNI